MSGPPAGRAARTADWAAPAVALGLAATVLGLSRFGYGVLLPAMRAELGWGYAQAGLLDTANAVGYLAGALLCPVLMSRAGAAVMLRICAAVTAASLLGCATTASLPVLLALRGLGGAAAAALFVAGGLLAAQLATATDRAGPVLGVYYAGVGPGILLTAVLAPVVLTDPGRWRFGWFVLGALATGCAAIAGRAAARLPASPPVPRRRDIAQWAAGLGAGGIHAVRRRLRPLRHVRSRLLAPVEQRGGDGDSPVGAARGSGHRLRVGVAQAAHAPRPCPGGAVGGRHGGVALPLASITTSVLALGVTRFRAYAARRGVRVNVALAERLVQAARQALPTAEAAVARQVLAADLALLDDLDGQVGDVDARLATLVPHTNYAILTTVPGWGTVRAAAYGAAVGPLDRWPSAKQLYRAAGLTPTVYEPAGRRRDGGISREGSVELRRALLDLGIGLWHQDHAAKAHAIALRERGKPGGIIATAMAHRANRIAYALVRDQTAYDPTRWS